MQDTSLEMQRAFRNGRTHGKCIQATFKEYLSLNIYQDDSWKSLKATHLKASINYADVAKKIAIWLACVTHTWSVCTWAYVCVRVLVNGCLFEYIRRRRLKDRHPGVTDHVQWVMKTLTQHTHTHTLSGMHVYKHLHKLDFWCTWSLAPWYCGWSYDLSFTTPSQLSPAVSLSLSNFPSKWYKEWRSVPETSGKMQSLPFEEKIRRSSLSRAVLVFPTIYLWH